MKCPKCNCYLPSDSEFCQYCGIDLKTQHEPNSIENKVEPSVFTMPQFPNFEKNTPDEEPDASPHLQAETLQKNRKTATRSKLNDQSDSSFGLVPENPIFTLSLKSVNGEIEYLENLYTINGEKINYKRCGSTGSNGIKGMIDVYETFLPSGHPYKTIYVNMYGKSQCTRAPVGFVYGKNTDNFKSNNDSSITPPTRYTSKSMRRKYCSNCGSPIDFNTKKCTGCGKQYFRGFRVAKVSIVLIILVLITTALCVLSILTQQSINRLEEQVSYLEQLNGITRR